MLMKTLAALFGLLTLAFAATAWKQADKRHQARTAHEAQLQQTVAERDELVRVSRHLYDQAVLFANAAHRCEQGKRAVRATAP